MESVPTTTTSNTCKPHGSRRPLYGDGIKVILAFVEETQRQLSTFPAGVGSVAVKYDTTLPPGTKHILPFVRFAPSEYMINAEDLANEAHLQAKSALEASSSFAAPPLLQQWECEKCKAWNADDETSQRDPER